MVATAAMSSDRTDGNNNDDDIPGQPVLLQGEMMSTMATMATWAASWPGTDDNEDDDRVADGDLGSAGMDDDDNNDLGTQIDSDDDDNVPGQPADAGMDDDEDDN